MSIACQSEDGREREITFMAETSDSLGVFPPWDFDSLDSHLRRSSDVAW
jgi:hypothetical protein